MSLKRAVSATLILLTVAACTDQYGQGPGPKQTVGTVLGAVGGAALGSQIGGGSGRVAAIAAGTLLGAALGGGIGQSMDRTDMMYYNQSSQNALETAKVGQTVAWNNPDSGNSGSFTPVRTYRNDSGSYCREYTQRISVGGKTQEGYGVACRQPDGSWRIVE